MRFLRYFLVILGVVAIVGALAALKGAQIGSLIAFGEQAQEAGPPPEAVSVAPAKNDTWEQTLEAVGSVTSSKGVAVTTETPGKVTRIRFDSGQTVAAGAVLVELDSSTERAQLRSLRARARLAGTTLQRSQTLLDRGAAPEAQLDSDKSAVERFRADIGALQAQIAKKTIRAPFAGRLGIRHVNLGQYLNAGDPITVLESVDGVYVDFNLPQQDLDRLELGMPVRVRGGGQTAPIPGKIAVIEPAVDPLSRQIGVRASIDEVERPPRPGMFVDVEVVFAEGRALVTVPATAIVHAPYGDSIFIVEDKPEDAPGIRETDKGQPVRIARQQFVRIGTQRGDYTAIEEGVKAGQSVVISGAFKLRNGAPVFVSDVVAIAPQLDPQPPNR